MLSDTNPASILAYLEEKIAGEFPDPPQADTQIKYVQESMQEYLSPAFYLIPAIDNPGENVIYINSGHLGDDISLFTTLAHEGYPGHLYQTTYFAGPLRRCASKPLMRRIISSSRLWCPTSSRQISASSAVWYLTSPVMKSWAPAARASRRREEPEPVQ